MSDQPVMEKRIITFDPVPHKYTDEFDNEYTSVTTVIGKVEPEYPAKFWAIYRAVDQVGIYAPRPFTELNKIEINFYGKRKKFSLDAFLAGIVPLNWTAEQITKEWNDMTEESCDWGTKKHDYLEGCINQFSKTNTVPLHNIVYDNTVRNTIDFAFKVSNLEELENSPLKFTYPTIYEKIKYYIENGWTAYAEKRVYTSYHLVAGTIDLLLVKNGKFIIIDWKTNKKPLYFKSGYYKKQWLPDRSKKVPTDRWVDATDTLKYPLSNIPYCKGEIYTLQVSLYAYICELWGLQHHGTIICHIRPVLDDHGEPKLDENGDRIEHDPEFYFPKYRKGEVARLLDWHSGRLSGYRPVMPSI